MRANRRIFGLLEVKYFSYRKFYFCTFFLLRKNMPEAMFAQAPNFQTKKVSRNITPREIMLQYLGFDRDRAIAREIMELWEFHGVPEEEEEQEPTYFTTRPFLYCLLPEEYLEMIEDDGDLLTILQTNDIYTNYRRAWRLILACLFLWGGEECGRIPNQILTVSHEIAEFVGSRYHEFEQALGLARRDEAELRSEEHTSELQSPRSTQLGTLFPYTTLFRS